MNRWQSVAAYVYLSICVYDFILVPVWIGIVRAFLIPFDATMLLPFDVSVQLRLLEAYTFQHEPFTLKGGGLFHLSFGALLTGSAMFNKRKDDEIS